MNELPVQIRYLLKKYGGALKRIVEEKSEEGFENLKAWTKRFDGGVTVVAKKDGKFVLVKHTPESWENYYCYWSFPGGRVKPGEDFEEAAVREFKEETGLNVEIRGLISANEHVITSAQGDQSVFYAAIFEGSVVGGKMKPENPDEISEIKLFEEVRAEDLVPWLRDARLI